MRSRSIVRAFASTAVAAVVASGCVGEAQVQGATPEGAPAGRPPTQYIVGVDISASRTPQEMADARTLLHTLAATLEPGDEVVFIETFRAGTDQAREWSDSLPALHHAPRMTGGERRQREDFRADVEAIADVFVDSVRSKSIATTDIVSTLWRAADHARAAGQRLTTIVLLSDMLNATPELNMERQGSFPDLAWISTRQAEGRIPRLDGVCVVAVGAELRSARGPRVQAFWDAYFRAAGTELPVTRFHSMVTDPGELRCR